MNLTLPAVQNVNSLLALQCTTIHTLSEQNVIKPLIRSCLCLSVSQLNINSLFLKRKETLCHCSDTILPNNNSSQWTVLYIIVKTQQSTELDIIYPNHLRIDKFPNVYYHSHPSLGPIISMLNDINGLRKFSNLQQSYFVIFIH